MATDVGCCPEAADFLRDLLRELADRITTLEEQLKERDGQVVAQHELIEAYHDMIMGKRDHDSVYIYKTDSEASKVWRMRRDLAPTAQAIAAKIRGEAYDKAVEACQEEREHAELSGELSETYRVACDSCCNAIEELKKG